ncbi:hypothetical protein DERP_012610, partial [Dermatophagoides pteronyssinus]
MNRPMITTLLLWPSLSLKVMGCSYSGSVNITLVFCVSFKMAFTCVCALCNVFNRYDVNCDHELSMFVW